MCTGLGKRELVKLLSHKSAGMQNLGLRLVLAFAERLQKLVSAVADTNSAVVDALVSASMEKLLPEFQFLLASAARCSWGIVLRWCGLT